MLISVSGSHGVGKTQFVSALSRKMQSKGYLVNSSASSSRAAWKLYYALNNIKTSVSWDSLSVQQHEEYQELYLSLLLASAKDRDSHITIFDRHVPDFLAYTLWKERIGLLSAYARQTLWQKAQQRILHAFILYLQPDIAYDIEEDGVRRTDRDEQLLIHNIFIEAVLPLFPSQKTLIVPLGTSEDRVSAACTFLYPHLRKEVVLPQ